MTSQENGNAAQPVRYPDDEIVVTLRQLQTVEGELATLANWDRKLTENSLKLGLARLNLTNIAHLSGNSIPSLGLTSALRKRFADKFRGWIPGKRDQDCKDTRPFVFL